MILSPSFTYTYLWLFFQLCIFLFVFRQRMRKLEYLSLASNNFDDGCLPESDLKKFFKTALGACDAVREESVSSNVRHRLDFSSHGSRFVLFRFIALVSSQQKSRLPAT